MKIYFNGCSSTEGAELENPQQSRYSKLICNHYNAEETNQAVSAGSNDRIIRNLLTEVDITQYDLGIIQMTYPLRTEWYSENECNWIRMNVNSTYVTNQKNDQLTKNIFSEETKFMNWKDLKNFNVIQDVWRNYYIHIVNDHYLKTKELIHINTIRDHFKSKNIPLVLLSINHITYFADKFDIILTIDKPYSVAAGGHPNEDGHKMIASDIIRYIKNENLL